MVQYSRMRYLESFLLKDLQKKMVFLGGPRQVGKTTLAEQILKKYQDELKQDSIYFNWDFDDDRDAILKLKWAEKHRLIIFDELHKYQRWKNWLKGIYDKQKKQHQFFVTGSARLDTYRRGGDSLLGRYHYWRLHPFTLSEMPDKMTSQEALQRLMTVGGFPEPFLDGDVVQAKRWRKERFDRVLKDDVRDLEPIQDIQNLSLFVDALRRRVGGLVVLSNIAEDIQISYKTLKKWLQVLERMYLVFVVRPFTKNISRAIQIPPKVYFFDNADVIGDEAAVFENLVACHLLKKIHFLEDRYGDRYEICYIRDKSRREVDFAIVKDGKLEELIEVKWSDEKISTALKYYSEKLQPSKSLQIVHDLDHSYQVGKIHVMPAWEALDGKNVFSDHKSQKALHRN